MCELLPRKDEGKNNYHRYGDLYNTYLNELSMDLDFTLARRCTTIHGFNRRALSRKSFDQVNERHGTVFNSVLIIQYRDEQTNLTWHKDNEQNWVVSTIYNIL